MQFGKTGVHQKTLNRLVRFIDEFKQLNFVGDRQMEAELDRVRQEFLSRTTEEYRDSNAASAMEPLSTSLEFVKVNSPDTDGGWDQNRSAVSGAVSNRKAGAVIRPTERPKNRRSRLLQGFGARLSPFSSCFWGIHSTSSRQCSPKVKAIAASTKAL